MRVLLIGGSQRLERSTIGALVARAHHVRLLSPHAAETAAEWPAHVEPWPERHHNATRPASANGCDIVLDLSGVEAARDATQPYGNHPQALVEAAQRAGVARYVYVSCPGCQREPDGEPNGEAEAAVRSLGGGWLVIRTEPVYGVGDDPISRFLLMMRSLPAVPMVGRDEGGFRPIWHEDLAAMLAASVEMDEAATRRTLHVAGPERITQQQLYDRIAALIDRRPLRVPVPEFVSQYGNKLAATGWLASLVTWPTTDPPTLRAQEQAREHARDQRDQADGDLLLSLARHAPTSLDEGLRRLINEQPELAPSDGVGTLQVKRFWADIRNSRYTASELLHLFRADFGEIMPVAFGVEPASPQRTLTLGATLTTTLPGRGHVQVRVEEVTDRHVTLATLRGHAMAGLVRFSTTPVGNAVRFEVMTCDTAANAIDWVTLTLGGAQLQNANWRTVVRNVVAHSGGSADEVHSDIRNVRGDAAEEIDEWVRDIIQRRHASENLEAARTPHHP